MSVEHEGREPRLRVGGRITEPGAGDWANLIASEKTFVFIQDGCSSNHAEVIQIYLKEKLNTNLTSLSADCNTLDSLFRVELQSF